LFQLRLQTDKSYSFGAKGIFVTILNDEIRRLVSEHRSRLAANDTVLACDLVRLRRRVHDILPVLDEITSSASRGVIRVTVKDSWSGHTAAILMTLGNIELVGECSDSTNIVPVGEGGFWYFFPCYSVDGIENWSFNDNSHGHIWFSSVEELFAHLVIRVAEELAIYEHANT
jgi:hypothetical protein